MTFKKKVLKNGMRVIVVPVKDAPSVTVMALVEAGSEYETREKNGISHFLEHMCFKGTKKRPTALDITKELDSIGSSYNAFTSFELTGYYAKAHYKHFNKVLDIISDIYLNSTFPEAEMEKEKGVIIEEINMYEDMPAERVSEVFDEVLYGDSPAGWRVIGSKENINKMQRQDFLDYHKAHYVPGKTVLVVSGNVSEKEVFKKAESIFGKIKKEKVIKKSKPVEKQEKPAIKIKDKETDQAHLVLGFRTFPVNDKRMPTLKVLATILGGGMSSRLFHKMREELGICYYVYTGIGDFVDHGHFSVSAGVDKNRLNLAVEEILKELKKITKEEVSSEELQKAKDYMVGRMYLGLESSNSLANFYGGQEIMRQKIKKPSEIEKEIRSVKASHIQNLAKTIIKNSNLNMAIVGRPTDEVKLKDIFKI